TISRDGIRNIRRAPPISWSSPDGDGAVRGFDRSMATERFIPGEGLAGALSAQERSYVAGLIDYAYARRKIPVLTDTRTLGRFAAFAGAPCAAHAQRLPPVGILHGSNGPMGTANSWTCC